MVMTMVIGDRFRDVAYLRITVLSLAEIHPLIGATLEPPSDSLLLLL